MEEKFRSVFSETCLVKPCNRNFKQIIVPSRKKEYMEYMEELNRRNEHEEICRFICIYFPIKEKLFSLAEANRSKYAFDRMRA